MAKELPYFKFEPNAWDNGNIQMLSREDKGLFIDICSMYWSRLGDLPAKLVIQKLCAGNATALNPLCDENIIEIIDGNVFIKFLTLQLDEFENTSITNSKNAKDGWEKRRKQKELSDRNATASKSQSETDAIREEKRRGDKIREKNTEGVIFNSENEPDKLQEIPSKKVAQKKVSFQPPDPAEVQKYCDERQNKLNGQEFCDFYTSKGWMVGKNKMIDWQAAVRTWEKYRTNGNTNNNRPNTGKISGHQFAASKLREHFTGNSQSGDYSIDVEAIEQR